MATLTSGSVVRITVVGDADSQAIVNQFHYAALPGTFTGISQGTGLQAAVEAFQAKWDAWVLPLLNENYNVKFIRGEAITGRFANPTAPPAWREIISDLYVLTPDPAMVGTRAGTATPTFEAFSLSYRGQPRTWRARGGSRLGPTVEEASVQNSLTVGALGDLQAAGAKLIEPLVLAPGTDELRRVVYSLKGLQTFGAPFVFPDSVVSPVMFVGANAMISTQVSRKRRQTLL